MLVDVVPTICGAVAVACEEAELNGRDLFGPVTTTPVAFSEYFSVEGGSYVSRMVLRDGLKLIETHDAARGQRRSELFDVHADPAEQRNLPLEDASPQRADDLFALREVLGAFEAATPNRRAPGVNVDAATQEALRNLGYDTLDRH
jgi:arylsulfatase A-like enzyme